MCRVLDLLIRQTQTDVPAEQYAEVLGLLALMLLHHSRRTARVGADGRLTLLARQDRSLWDQRKIEEGLTLVEKAFYMRHIGPYQIQAAISALHVQASSAEDTDWKQIAGLFKQLRQFTDTPIIRLNQAVAISLFAGPEEGLRLVQELADELNGYALFHLARADMLKRMGKPEESRQAYQQALTLTQNQAEREFISDQIKTI